MAATTLTNVRVPTNLRDTLAAWAKEHHLINQYGQPNIDAAAREAIVYGLTHMPSLWRPTGTRDIPNDAVISLRTQAIDTAAITGRALAEGLTWNGKPRRSTLVRIFIYYLIDQQPPPTAKEPEPHA